MKSCFSISRKIDFTNLKRYSFSIEGQHLSLFQSYFIQKDSKKRNQETKFMRLILNNLFSIARHFFLWKAHHLCAVVIRWWSCLVNCLSAAFATRTNVCGITADPKYMLLVHIRSQWHRPVNQWSFNHCM